jgi:hypothetical protein
MQVCEFPTQKLFRPRLYGAVGTRGAEIERLKKTVSPKIAP